jgi:hypothetical protein
MAFQELERSSKHRRYFALPSKSGVQAEARRILSDSEDLRPE